MEDPFDWIPELKEKCEENNYEKRCDLNKKQTKIILIFKGEGNKISNRKPNMAVT